MRAGGSGSPRASASGSSSSRGLPPISRAARCRPHGWRRSRVGFALFLAVYVELVRPGSGWHGHGPRSTLAGLAALLVLAIVVRALGAPSSFDLLYVFFAAAIGMRLQPRAALVVIVATGGGPRRGPEAGRGEQLVVRREGPVGDRHRLHDGGVRAPDPRQRRAAQGTRRDLPSRRVGGAAAHRARPPRPARAQPVDDRAQERARGAARRERPRTRRGRARRRPGRQPAGARRGARRGAGLPPARARRRARRRAERARGRRHRLRAGGRAGRPAGGRGGGLRVGGPRGDDERRPPQRRRALRRPHPRRGGGGRHRGRGRRPVAPPAPSARAAASPGSPSASRRSAARLEAGAAPGGGFLVRLVVPLHP